MHHCFYNIMLKQAKSIQVQYTFKCFVIKNYSFTLLMLTLIKMRKEDFTFDHLLKREYHGFKTMSLITSLKNVKSN